MEFAPLSRITSALIQNLSITLTINKSIIIKLKSVFGIMELLQLSKQYYSYRAKPTVPKFDSNVFISCYVHISHIHLV